MIQASLPYTLNVLKVSGHQVSVAEEPLQRWEIAKNIFPELSEREAETLSWLTDGLPDKVIANKMCITQATVKVHMKTVVRKLNIYCGEGRTITNRTQAALFAMSRGVPSIFDG